MDFFSIPTISNLTSIVICWALFSLACSGIHEAMVRIKAERGRFMKTYILQQLDDAANDINWGLELYRQGPVALLSRDVRKPTDQIDPDIFATTLLSAVANSNLVLNKLQTLQTRAAEGSAEAGALLTQLTDIAHPTLRHFKAATLLLHPSDQVGLFSSLMANAELKASSEGPAIYDNVINGLKEWYGGLTDRLSLWYKKATHRRLFWLGLVIAVVVNVDSVRLFEVFNANPQAKTAIIEAYHRDSAYLNRLAQQPAGSDSMVFRQWQGYTNQIHALADSTGLPVGFSYSVFKSPPTTRQDWMLKVLGLLISAFAASLGAPFWFDVVNKALSLKPKT